MACNANNSQVLNKRTVLLIGKAHYDENFKLIEPKLTDLMLPDAYSSVKDSSGKVFDTVTLANSKETQTVTTGYDPSITFKTRFQSNGALDQMLNDYIRARHVGIADNMVVWEIYDLTDSKWDDKAGGWTGSGFHVRQWVGALSSDVDFNSGDDTKIVERTWTLKNDQCGEDKVIKDASYAPLIAAFGLIKHWGKSGLWDNSTNNKIVATK